MEEWDSGEETRAFHCFFKKIFFYSMFIDLRVRGMEGERERNMDVTDNTDQLPLVHAPMGTNQQPWHVPSQGMEPATFLFTA